MFRKFVTGILFVLLISCSEAPVGQQGEVSESTITWDNWGIPHIKGQTADATAYGFGWAQMKSHANLITELYGTARGKAAEYWGEEFLDSDRFIRTMGVPGRARAIFNAHTPEYQKRLQAFVKGMNDYATAHPDALDADKAQVLPFTPEDVLAHIQNSLHLTFVSSKAQAQGIAARWKTNGEKPGSNAWAIAAGKSESGNAMLLANPHLPWQGLFLFYEAQLSTADLNAYGVSLVGWPFLIIAFNEKLGWSHTVNTYDGADIYELTLQDEGYLFGDDVLPFGKTEEIIRIKQEDGSFREESFEILTSVHGPIISRIEGQNGEKALALKVAGLEEPDRNSITRQYWDMAAATSLDEFESILSRLQMPMLNTVYADKAGNIFYEFNALQPVRNKGDVAFWSGIIDGSDPELLWQGYRSYDELPKFRNPESGFIQNSNDPPWTSTFPQVLKAKDYPDDTAPQFMHFRAQNGAGMLLGDGSISYEELVTYRASNRLVLADIVLPELINGAKASGDPTLIEAANVLENWDRNTHPDSAGAVLFQDWATKLGGQIFSGSLFIEKWSPDNPLKTPNGLKDVEAAVKVLKAAATDTIANFGRLDVPWGEAVRMKYAGKDLPASTGPGGLGAIRVAFLAPGEKGTFKVLGGNSYVAAIEFGDRIKASGILAYGNATQPSSPHFGDQLDLFAKGEFRPIWFYPDDVAENAKEVEDLKYSP